MKDLNNYIIEKFKISKDIKPTLSGNYLVFPWGKLYSLVNRDYKYKNRIEDIMSNTDAFIFTENELIEIYNEYIKDNKDLDRSYDKLYIYEIDEKYNINNKNDLKKYVKANKLFSQGDVGIKSKLPEIDIEEFI